MLHGTETKSSNKYLSNNQSFDTKQDKSVNFVEENVIDFDLLSKEDRQNIMLRVKSDESLPVDAFALGQNEIRRELIERGIQPKGFFNDDATVLQEEYNREHRASVETRKKFAIEIAAKEYVHETSKRKKEEKEKELKDEIQAIENNPKLQLWIHFAKNNITPSASATIQLNSVGTRALCKSLAMNHSLINLDLGRNNLNDMAGKSIAQMLRTNNCLKKLELNGNLFGAITARELASALTGKNKLEYLNLDNNPLSDGNIDFTGVIGLGDCIKENNSLLALHIWQSQIGNEAGKAFSKSIQKNDKIIILEIGYNDISYMDAKIIQEKLDENIKIYEAQQELKSKKQIHINEEKELENRKLEKLKQQDEHKKWLESRRIERQTERERLEAERQRKIQEEKNAKRQLAERKQAESMAREQAAKAKAKKKTKGRKGKKSG